VVFLSLERRLSSVMSMSACVCLFVGEDISTVQNHTCGLYQIFVHVAYVSGLVLWHVDDRPHRLSAGIG